MIEIIRCVSIEEFVDINTRATNYFNMNKNNCANWSIVNVKNSEIIFKVGDEIKPILSTDELNRIEQVDNEYLIGI